MSWETILFDLDGTLTDPAEGITKAVEVALNHYGITVEDRSTLNKFIGPPLDESFPEFYGFNDEQVREATRVFREYFGRQGWAENIPYLGIDKLLSDLKAAGKKLIIATSKPEEFAVRIMNHFDLAQYMDVIAGASTDNQEGAKKANVIRKALQRAGVEDLSTTVMVGDRRHDVAGGHEVGLKVIGVLYGYGDRAEHEAAGADYIVEDIPSLEKLLLG